MLVSMTMTEVQHSILMEHLFPSDGCEAVAIALCARVKGADTHRLLLRHLELIPYGTCSVRLPDRVTWPTDVLIPLLEQAAKKDWAIVKIHGHRDVEQFSHVDDHSDRQLFPSIYSWTDSPFPHASVILMSDGYLFGRTVSIDGVFSDLAKINVIGDDIKSFVPRTYSKWDVPEFGRRIAQAFGARTYEQLRQLKVAVVGCSGTGSPVIEQLARNCVGTLVLVDPDHVETKNLNRILNTTMVDADKGLEKVYVAKRSVEAMGLGTLVITHPKTLFDRDVIRDIANCDIIFGCMDSIDGRFILNKLASFYMLPYFDLGVKIQADGKGGVEQVCGTVHYVKPGGSSLLSRHLFTMEQVRAAGIKRSDPQKYQQLLEEGYIRGVQEDRPAVIQLNSLIASLAVNELLARLHPYRADPNNDYAINRISLMHGIFDHETDGEPCPVLGKHVGRGDVEPLLDWPELSKKE